MRLGLVFALALTATAVVGCGQGYPACEARSPALTASPSFSSSEIQPGGPLELTLEVTPPRPANRTVTVSVRIGSRAGEDSLRVDDLDTEGADTVVIDFGGAPLSPGPYALERVSLDSINPDRITTTTSYVAKPGAVYVRSGTSRGEPNDGPCASSRQIATFNVVAPP
jgi:hypothetical protein